MYLFNESKTKVYSVDKFSEPFQSWLHEGVTIPKGELHIVTPFDAALLVLPYISKVRHLLIFEYTFCQESCRAPFE
jgi:hypothetical protein